MEFVAEPKIARIWFLKIIITATTATAMSAIINAYSVKPCPSSSLTKFIIASILKSPPLVSFLFFTVLIKSNYRAITTTILKSLKTGF